MLRAGFVSRKEVLHVLRKGNHKASEAIKDGKRSPFNPEVLQHSSAFTSRTLKTYCLQL